jgi:DMSO/TMAO reductase YedYZ molybdopterin-dependent catalytic subunit
MAHVKSIADRTPPGQTLTTKWPVLHYSDVPTVTKDTFRFKISGLVERPAEWRWDELTALPSVRVTSDFHCVTTWSRLDNVWEGVRFSTVAERAGAKPQARHAMIFGADGYTTNVPLEWLMQEDVLFAWSHDGQPLEAVHGGPLRLVVPKLYAWKSAKWVSGVDFMRENRRGFWEQRGYHNRGEPFAEERYSYQETD